MPKGAPVSFSLPEAAWAMCFSESAVSVLNRKAQRWCRSESVGQLFTADLAKPTIVIDVATVLKPLRSSWASVTFDAAEAMRQREERFRQGLYCIGLWHTHPEPAPDPSGTDERLAADHAQAAVSVLNALAFVIVGTRAFPDGWYVGFHDGRNFHRAVSINSISFPWDSALKAK